MNLGTPMELESVELLHVYLTRELKFKSLSTYVITEAG
jgi:hypothetical protein